MRTKTRALMAWFILAGRLLGTETHPTAADLAQGFVHPPAAARPWVYYFIMDGNLSREGITADFEAMRRAGLGGMILMEVDAGVPRGPVNFMSAEWRQLFKHAVAEAERLGLQITLNAGPGWTGSGGPWVKPEQSMQHVVASAVAVAGPTNFSALLPRPTPRAPYFGNAGLPAELLQAKDAFYADLAVLAFPQVNEAVRIADLDEKALYLRHPYSSRPGTKPFLPAPAQYPAWPADAVIPAERIVDLTDRLQPDGRLDWNVPPGQWTILRFGRTSTGANTRPAPLPGLGWECDKFDPAALDAHFDAFIGALLRELGPRSPATEAGWTMLHIDSWEMGAQNWTAAFRDEFHQRRGYDPLRYLPAVTGRVVESLERSERFLWDLRQTAQELVIANHAQHLKELGHRHGFGLSIEPYDMNPCSDMSLGAVADVPMCEFWLYGFDSTFSVIEAASIAHTLGRPIVAAEAFTSSDAERWQAHPATMKSLGDWSFCAGVNRLVFHRYQHQPWLDRYPGLTMGPYGVHWERTQTWWDMVPAYHQYLARCQFLLRQGLPVADVCYLVAEGAPHVFRPPPSATLGHPPDRRGYNFDGCTPETLLTRMTVKDGRLVLPDGMSYRLLVLPERDTMTPGLLRKVKELVIAGATVIGPQPLKSPSLSGYPECDAEVKHLGAEMWSEAAAERWSSGVMEQWSDAPKPPDSSLSSLQHSNTPTLHRPLGEGRLVWQPRSEMNQPAEPDEPLRSARWIWHPEGRPAARAPVGQRFFQRTLGLQDAAGINSARMFLTADNAFELWVNGESAGRGDNFHLTYAMDVTQFLRAGTNLLAVIAENGGDAPNPAGLIGALFITYADGRQVIVPTDSQWHSAHTAPAGWATNLAAPAGWRPAMDLGALGMAPWGAVGQSATEPEQYGDFALVARVLNSLEVPPDFESDGPLRYTHRRAGEADVYFVSNREDRWVGAQCVFRVSGKVPALWNPMTGESTGCAVFQESDGRTRLPLWLEPAGSVFVVFRPGPSPVDAVAAWRRNGQSLLPEPGQLKNEAPVAELHANTGNQVRLLAWQPGTYALTAVSGKTAELEIAALPAAMAVAGPWNVRFQPRRGAPAATTLDQLLDWSQHPDARIQHFSGMATYRTAFHWSAMETSAGNSTTATRKAERRQFLDLGEVQVMAQVKLNGHDLGVLWKRPFRVEVTEALQAGDNVLEITVANLWPNRLIGDQALPVAKRVTWTSWNPFTKATPLLPSGLLGPVVLQSAVAVVAEPQ